MITNIVIEERELDGSYVGPIKVEVAQDLQVQNLDGLSEFKKEIEAIKDDAKVSATDAAQSATDAAASATAIQGIEAIVTKKAQEVETNANTVAAGVAQVTSDTAKAVKSASDAAASETLAKQYATNPEDSEVGTTGEYSALHWAAKAKTYAQALASGVTYRGEWDASKGVFPTPTLSPERIDYYRIKVAGTMSNSQNPNQPDVTVSINDALFWNDVKDIWYEIESTGVHSVNGKTPDPAGDVVVTANDIDLVDGESIQTKFDDNIWISACRTKAEFDAWRDENKRLYPASGFHDWGNVFAHSLYPAVNGGMWTATEDVNLSNRIAMGRSIANGGKGGNTEFPRTLIAGVISEIYGIGGNPTVQNEVSLPEAEKGLRTFDSATGISTVHASAAEAFAGVLADITPDLGTNVTRNIGKVTLSSVPANHKCNWDIPAGTYTLEYTVSATTSGSSRIRVLNGREITSPEVLVLTTDTTTPTTTKSVKVTLSNPGRIFVEAMVNDTSGTTSLQLRPVTEEVVIRRVDMGGGEWFLRKVTTADSYVYHKGNIQSEVTTANGVPTTVNTQRPSSYFDQYVGQNGGQKRGWDWTKLTIAQKLAIVSDFTNLLYWDGKDLYQWCLRVRTFAGSGNGDWDTVDSSAQGNNTLRAVAGAVTARIPPQGKLDEVPLDGSGNNYYADTSSIYNINPEVGLFTARRTTVSDGECYFQVWFVVTRLNQGAYHPEFNEMGAGFLGAVEDKNYKMAWYDTSSDTPLSVQSTLDTFINKSGIVPNGSIGTTANVRGFLPRPDGRYYDAIYASGLGGVNDYRMTCKDTGKPEYVAGKMPEIINGNYRGAEKLRHTLVEHLDPSVLPGGGNAMWSGTSNTGQGNTSGWIGLTKSASTYGFEVGDAVTLYKPSTNTLVRGTIVVPSGDESVNKFVRVVMDDSIGRNQTVAAETDSYVIIERQSDITVSGEYYQKNIIGDPANILAVFPNGGYWEWIPDLPPLVGGAYMLTHPSTSPNTNIIYTSNAGVRWDVGTYAIDAATNSPKDGIGQSSHVVLLSYKTKARQTKPTTNKAISHGKAGIGDVFSSCWWDEKVGRLLGYSLTGKVLKSNAAKPAAQYEYSAISSYVLLPESGMLNSDRQGIKHTPLSLVAPTSGSGAVKFLWSQFSKNKQSNIQFNWRELVHNGTNWGDDGKIHIRDGDVELIPDTNGTLTKVGTDELVKPLGYTW